MTELPLLDLDGSSLTIADLVAVADRGRSVRLAPAARKRMLATRAIVDRIVATAYSSDPTKRCM